MIGVTSCAAIHSLTTRDVIAGYPVLGLFKEFCQVLSSVVSHGVPRLLVFLLFQIYSC